VVSVDGLELAADAAGLPPDATPQLAAGVDPLVREGVDETQISDPVVLLVFVVVVDSESCGDGTFVFFPDEVMHESAAALGGDPDPVVALAGRVPESAGMAACWSSLAHASQWHNSFSAVKPASLSLRLGFAQA